MLAQRPLGVSPNPFASMALQQQPPAMVPQPPAMVPQNLPAQPVALERAGSLNTQRSHSSQREWAAAAAVPASRKAATTSRRPATQASKKGGRRDAALPRAAVPAKQHAQQAQQQTQQQAQQQAQLHQQLERVLSAKASLPPAAQVAAAPAAVELPVALSPIVFSGFPSAGGLPAALQQEQPRQLRPLVHWASHDPSAQRPVKRGGWQHGVQRPAGKRGLATFLSTMHLHRLPAGSSAPHSNL